MSKANREARRIARANKANPESFELTREAPFWLQRKNVLTLSLLLLGLVVYRFVVFAQTPGPPGSDAGNWLAFANELFGGNVKAATSMYFPVTLVLLKSLMLFAGPLVAVKLLGILASVAIGVPFFYLLRRSCSPVMAAALTFCLLMAGYQLEMLSWGGYPQLLASAFMLTSLILLDEGLTTGSRSKLLWAAGFGALIAGTHHFTLMMYAGIVALYVPAMVWRYRADLRTLTIRFATFAGAGLAFSAVFAPWYLKYMSIVANSGSLNANAAAFGGINDVLSFVYAEAPLTWMLLMAGAPIVAFAPFGKPDGWRLRHIALPLIFGSAAFYLGTHEVRVFQVMQIGILISFGAFCAKVEDYLREKPLQFTVQRVGYATYGMAIAALVLLFGMNGMRHFDGAVHRYMGVDAQAKQALDWVRNNTPSDAKFLTAGGRQGWVNYAWWVEGYGERRSLGLIMPDFLAFREEREQTQIAARMVDEETPATVVRELLEEQEIDYLFVYKPSGGAVQSIVNKVPVYLSYENNAFVVLKVRRAEFASAN